MTNFKVKNFLIKYHDGAVNLSGFLATSLVFLSGIGRYRTVLAYALYCLLKGLWAVVGKGAEAKYILLPTIIISLYFDLTKGQIWPLFERSYFIVSVGIAVVLDTLARRRVQKLIEEISKGDLFIICPSCNYDNKELVKICQACSYKKGDPFSALRRTDLLSVRGEKGGVIRMPERVIQMLGIKEQEKILFSMRVFPFKSVFRNGEQEIVTFFVLTNTRIIFLDYHYFSYSWRKKDILSLSDIISVQGKMKKMYMVLQPEFVITTRSGDIYEIVYKKYGRYRQRIEDVCSLIKKINPEINVSVDLPESQWKIRLDF